MADPAETPKFHSVDPAQLQQISLDDIETGNLFPDQVLIEMTPEVLREPNIHPRPRSPYLDMPDGDGDVG